MLRVFLLFAVIVAGFAVGAALRLDAHRAPGGSPGDQPPVASPGTGAIVNGSFEEMDGKLPRGWKTAQWQRSASFAIDPTGHTGRASARISSTEGGDASWTTVVELRPYAKYRLSGWIKTENLEAGTGKGALLNLHTIGGVQTQAVTGTHEWTRVELTFDSEGNDAVQVNCLFGGWGKSRGTAWFDDIQIEQLSARELAPAVTIHALRSRAPMSKYIYGQFIEHLGRCIYGGIWAEMLEDRKFFHAVGDPGSPWKPAGEPTSVTMNTASPFVGAHTLDITLAGNGKPGGVEQGELGVTVGKKYVGPTA